MFLGPTGAGGSATMAQVQRETPSFTEPLAEGTREGDAMPAEAEQREIERAEAGPEADAIDLAEQMTALLAEIEQSSGGSALDELPAATGTPESDSSTGRLAPEHSIEAPAGMSGAGHASEVVAAQGGAGEQEVPREAQTTLAGELDAALKEASEALEHAVPPKDPPLVAADDPIQAEDEQRAESHAGARSKREAMPPQVQSDLGAAGSAVDLSELDALLARQAEELEKSGREASADSAPASDAAPAPESDQDDDRFSEARLAAAGSVPAANDAEVHATAHSTSVSTATASESPVFVAAPVAPVAQASVTSPGARPIAPVRKKIALGPAFAATGKALGFPMALVPAPARDAVAYLAAVTLFNALAVWGYMLFVYKAPVPPPAHDAPSLHAVEPAPDASGGDHAPGAKEGHQETKPHGGLAGAAETHAPGGETEHGHDAHVEAPSHGAHDPAPH